MVNYCSFEIGRKLRILSFVATIIVICIHTNYLESYSINSVSWWVGNCIGYLQHWAVPFFFIVSGFFFGRYFRGKSIFNSYFPFLSKKARTLLVPYLLWGAIYGTFMITLCAICVAFMNGEKDLLSKTVFAQCDVWQIIDSIVGVTRPPLNGALWYVRILMLFFILSPFVLIMFRCSRWLGLFLGLGFILLSPIEGTYSEVFNLPCIGQFSFKINSIGWILIGMGIGQFNVENTKMPFAVGISSFVLWLLLSLSPLFWISQDSKIPTSILLLHRCSPLFFVVFYWYIGDVLSKILPINLPRCFSLAFWIYCMHHPITSYVGSLRHMLFGHSLIVDWVWQFIAFIFVFIVCYTAGVVAIRFFPKSFKVLSGGR